MAQTIEESDELLDLVDSSDNVVGRVKRGEMVQHGYDLSSHYVRFVCAFIVNTQDEIWVPKRGLHKSIAPGGYDFSVAEHVKSGETYQQAIQRAFSEEAGLQVTTSTIKSLGKLIPTVTKPSYEMVFVLDNYQGPDPVHDPHEFSSARWLGIVDLEKALRSGLPLKTAFPPALELLRHYLAVGK